jgi:hypothetical protein
VVLAAIFSPLCRRNVISTPKNVMKFDPDQTLGSAA